MIVERAIAARVEALRLKPALDKVLAASSARAASSVMSLLASPRIAASPALTAAALGALNAKPAGDRVGERAGLQVGERDAGLDHARVLQIGAELADGAVGNGLEKLERHAGDAVTRTALVSLASNDNWRKLDTAARSAEGTKLDQLSARLTRIPGAPATAASTPASEPALADPASKVGVAGKVFSAPAPATTASKAATVKAPAAKTAAVKTTGVKKTPAKKVATKKTAATKRSSPP